MLSTSIVLLAVLASAFATPIITDPNRNPSGRVVGGVTVNLGQVPHMVSIRSATNVHFCGGSVISTRYVLTSAQCTIGRPLASLRLYVATVTLNAGGAVHNSLNITIHPGYDPVTHVNDLSLVYTATVMVFNVNTQAAIISPNIFGANAAAQMSGWGTNTVGGGQPPNNLMRMNTVTITNEECRERLSPLNAARITDNKICTLTRSTNGNCYGDEGGSLIVGGQLIGVASWQVSCASGVPDVYERIAPHRLWITSLI